MDLTKETTKKICFIITFTVFLVLCIIKINDIIMFLQRIFSVISPIVIGACIAFVINLPMKKIEKVLEKHVFKGKEKFLRITSLLLTITLIVLIFAIVIGLIIPQIGNSVDTLLPKIQPFINNVNSWLTEQFSDHYLMEQLAGIELDWATIYNSVMSFFRGSVLDFFADIFSFAGSFVSILINIFISFIFSIYILLSKEKLGKRIEMVMTAFIPERVNKTISKVLTLSNYTFGKFIAGQCTEAVILGSIFFVALGLLRMPYALLISVLIGVTSIIPVVGAFIGCIIGAFLILIESPMQSLIFVITFLVIQQIEGNVIYPKVVGSSIGIPPILMLFAVTVGGSLWGILGMLFFIPIAAVAYSLLKTATYKRLDINNDMEKDT